MNCVAPKLVLSHIRSDNGVLKAVIDRLQNGLGRKGGGLHAQGMLLLPALKLRQPFPGGKRLCLFQQGGDCAFASATTGISTEMFLEMEAASISMWTMEASLAKVSVLPVMRSLNRVPMEKSKSHLLTARLAAKLPCMPIFPIQAVTGGNGALSHDGGNDGNPVSSASRVISCRPARY